MEKCRAWEEGYPTGKRGRVALVGSDPTGLKSLHDVAWRVSGASRFIEDEHLQGVEAVIKLYNQMVDLHNTLVGVLEEHAAATTTNLDRDFAKQIDILDSKVSMLFEEIQTINAQRPHIQAMKAKIEAELQNKLGQAQEALEEVDDQKEALGRAVSELNTHLTQLGLEPLLLRSSI